VNPFAGGVAVITGAGAGIGAGLARYASQLGMTVVLAEIDADAIAALRDELCETGGSPVDVICDVRDPAAPPHRIPGTSCWYVHRDTCCNHLHHLSAQDT
jgi:NADP-dependent 3-hydroxy acid dehydrogenase YdfG